DEIESTDSSDISNRFWTEILYLSKFTSKPYQLLDDIISKKILIIGAGALGSSLVLKLSAIGIKSIYCIDGDKIELDNLTRQILYTPKDISDGLFKVEPLNNMIKKFYPESCFLGIQKYINSYEDCLRYIPKDVDLIIQTADYPIGEIDDWVNKFSQSSRIPVIYSHFGSVGPFVVPTKSPCLNCLNKFLDRQTEGLHSITKNLYENKPNSKSPSFVMGTQINELLILDFVKKYWITGEMEKVYNKVFTFYDGYLNIREIEFSFSEKCMCRENKNG
ncbi:HesA/MoeB/ThiF family protein, partial [Streptococcus dysgalactiae]|uniref:HesA/MoeB/ThiF family protein n=1 Tax=Streptococcus dysgalactiae TaxID=1334 RepID=UPI0022B67FF0